MHRVLVEGSPQLYVSTPVQTTVGLVAVLVAAVNPKRKGFIIQNTGTTVIKVSLGTTDPTQTVYTVGLKGGSAADDGLGGSYFDESWVGQIRAVSDGAGGTFVFSEFESGGPDWNAAGDYY